MGELRRVTDKRAGPKALGVLVPPGRRTFLILRPRSLACDLIAVRADGAFREMSREEADEAAADLGRALDACAAGGPGAVETVGAPDCRGYWLRVRVGAFALLACPRDPGRPYRPAVFDGAEAARAAADQVAAILCPPAGVAQELYFNTRHFGQGPASGGR
jgi:hypothetical protein